MARIEPLPYDEIDPQLRARFDAGMAEGRYTTTVPLQVYAYAPVEATALDENYRLTFRQGTLGTRLEELLRLRSAQLNGCAPCASSRKDDSITEDDVACLTSASLASDERERRALEFLELMCSDHFAIGEEHFLRLAEVFTVPEIVELGMMCARYIGGHRFTHVLDVLGDSEPVLRRPQPAAAGG